MATGLNLPDNGSDKRTNDRIRSFLRAQIIFNNRMTTIECIIKNISSTGARVALNESLALPAEFEIYIPQRGRSHHAKLVWRDKESIGVNFVDELQDAPLGTAPSQPEISEPVDAVRLRELEDQNAQLKARIRLLSRKLQDLGLDPTIIV